MSEYCYPTCEQLGSPVRNSWRRQEPNYRPQLEALEQRLVLDFATGAISAVAVTGQDTVYALAHDSGNANAGANIWRHDSTGWNQLTTNNFYQTVSAGIDLTGNPMVFALDITNSVWANAGGIFVSFNIGVQFTQITGGVNQTVFAIDNTGAIWRHQLSGWQPLTGPVGAQQISNGTAPILGAIANRLFAVGPDHNPYVDLNPDSNVTQQFQRLDNHGLVQSVRAGTEPAVFAITTDGSVFKGTGSSFQLIYSSSNGAADNVSVVTNNGVDSALITNSNEDLILAGASGASLISGNCACVGEIAGTSSGTIFATAETGPSTEASDLWFQSSGSSFAQLSSSGLIFDPVDTNVY